MTHPQNNAKFINYSYFSVVSLFWKRNIYKGFLINLSGHTGGWGVPTPMAGLSPSVLLKFINFIFVSSAHVFSISDPRTHSAFLPMVICSFKAVVRAATLAVPTTFSTRTPLPWTSALLLCCRLYPIRDSCHTYRYLSAVLKNHK